MPIELADSIEPEVTDSIRKGEGIWMSPHYAHLRAAEKRLIEDGSGIIWGEVLFTPSTLAKTFSDPLKPKTTPLLEKVAILDILKKTNLRYFDSVKGGPAIGNEFHRAITTLRKNLISSDRLERDLQERGSLKEFDLLTVYKRYEERMDELGLLDEGGQLGDIISTIEKAGSPSPGPSPQGRGNRSDGGLLRSARNDIKTIIFDGFEIISPGLAALIKKIAEHYPSVRIIITRQNIPSNPIYAKYLDLVEGSLAELNSSDNGGLLHPLPHPSPRGGAGEDARNDKEEEDKWILPCKVELHACRSVGNECRFIGEAIIRLIKNGGLLRSARNDMLGGIEPEKIGIVALPNSNTLTNLLFSLKNYGLIPSQAFSCFEGRRGAIKKEIQAASSLGELAERLKSRFTPMLKNSFRVGPHLPQTALNLKQLENIFTEIFYLENLGGLDLDIDIIKDSLLSHIEPDPKHALDRELCAFSWMWWGEDIYPPLDVVFIPSMYQGKIPPEGSQSIFFQETAFLPGNAPAYFAQLFPQADCVRARESYRLSRYLMSAGERAILSLSRVNREGKETYPSSLTAMFDLAPIDEGHRPCPAKTSGDIAKDIMRRAQNELADRKRFKQSPSVIDEAEVKDNIKKRFNDHPFSATQLEKYGRCPYQYFLEKVIGLEPIDPVTPEINPKHRGTIIHYILELFYTHEVENLLKFIRGEIPLTLIEEGLNEYIERALVEYKELVSNTHPALVDHFKKRARVICMNSVQMEIDMINQMTFPLLPAYTEWKFGKEDVPYLTLKGSPLEHEARLSGIIDRIDIDTEHDTFSITDYKTGETQSIMGKIRKGEHLQMPLYIEAVRRILLPGKKPAGAFLFSLKKMEKKHGMARDDTKSFYFRGINPRLFVDDQEWNELIDTTLKTASRYITKIRNAEFVENASNCNHLCDFKEICRYGKK